MKNLGSVYSLDFPEMILVSFINGVDPTVSVAMNISDVTIRNKGWFSWIFYFSFFPKIRGLKGKRGVVPVYFIESLT